MKIKNPPGEPGGLQLKTTIVARFDMASIGTAPDLVGAYF